MNVGRRVRIIVALAGIASTVALGGRIAQADEMRESSHSQKEGCHHCRCHHHHHFRHHFEKMAAALGLSEQQKMQVKEIFKKNMADMKPIFDRLMSERRNLRVLIQADKTDEAAIRAEVVKLAAVEGDLAIQRARMDGAIRAILTSPQQEKFKALQLEREKKLACFHERMHKRFENYTTSK